MNGAKLRKIPVNHSMDVQEFLTSPRGSRRDNAKIGPQFIGGLRGVTGESRPIGTLELWSAVMRKLSRLIFNRPYGTKKYVGHPVPAVKTTGYFQLSLWDHCTQSNFHLVEAKDCVR